MRTNAPKRFRPIDNKKLTVCLEHAFHLTQKLLFVLRLKQHVRQHHCIKNICCYR